MSSYSANKVIITISLKMELKKLILPPNNVINHINILGGNPLVWKYSYSHCVYAYVNI